MASQLSQSSLLSPSRIGDVNRSRVLQALCDHGPHSRAELAKMAGVTRATIGNIVQGLLESGLIEELEAETGIGKVGKPGTPVWFGPMAGLTGAVSVGAESVQAALVNARGDTLEETASAIEGSTIDDASLARCIADALAKVLPKQADLLGVGVTVPGVCDTLTGRVIGSGQLPRLAGTALMDELGRRVKRRVLLDNDSRAQALGEKWFGEGRGLSTFVSVQTGHGIGAGIVFGGTVFRGRGGQTGEVGHTCVDANGELCRCGLRGCWETVASLDWLRAEARHLKIRGAGGVDAKGLVAAAEQSDTAAALLQRYAENLAVGLATLTQILNPERLILHGDVVGGGEVLRAKIHAAVRSRSLGYLRPTVDVVLSRLDQRATLLGAAGLVLSETFNLST